METFSALLVLCPGNSPVTGEFPSQRPVTRSFDVFFDLIKPGHIMYGDRKESNNVYRTPHKYLGFFSDYKHNWKFKSCDGGMCSEM